MQMSVDTRNSCTLSPPLISHRARRRLTRVIVQCQTPIPHKFAWPVATAPFVNGHFADTRAVPSPPLGSDGTCSSTMTLTWTGSATAIVGSLLRPCVQLANSEGHTVLSVDEYITRTLAAVSRCSPAGSLRGAKVQGTSVNRAGLPTCAAWYFVVRPRGARGKDERPAGSVGHDVTRNGEHAVPANGIFTVLVLVPDTSPYVPC